MPGVIILSAVWLFQTSLLEVYDVVPARPRRGTRQVVRPAQGGRHAGQQEALPGKDDRLPALDAEMGQPDLRPCFRMHEQGLDERHHVRRDQGRQPDLLNIPFLDCRRLCARDCRIRPPRYGGHGGPLHALEMAIRKFPAGTLSGLIHHSNRAHVLFKGVRVSVAGIQVPTR